MNELYPKMRRIQFTLEDKEQTEAVLNTFFATDEKTAARGKEETDFKSLMISPQHRSSHLRAAGFSVSALIKPRLIKCRRI